MNRRLADNIEILAFDVFGTAVEWQEETWRG